MVTWKYTGGHGAMWQEKVVKTGSEGLNALLMGLDLIYYKGPGPWAWGPSLSRWRCGQSCHLGRPFWHIWNGGRPVKTKAMSIPQKCFSYTHLKHNLEAKSARTKRRNGQIHKHTWRRQHSSVTDRTSRQKNQDRNLNTVNQLDPADTAGTLHNSSRYAFQVHMETFTKVDHI